MEPFRIFVGYDTRERVAYHVLTESILRHASIPLTFMPLALSNIPEELFYRSRDPKQSTDFAFTRFLVPYLSGYRGWSLFLDCDFVIKEDVASLLSLLNDRYSVLCCKHVYTPRTTTKFLNQEQTKYEKKNWSSFVLFNNARCTSLTPKVVNEESGAYLHQFGWLQNEDLIGDIPLEWNFLVGEYQRGKQLPKGIHYTLGGPYFRECNNCEYAAEWSEELHHMLIPLSLEMRK